jgi:2-keto-4-pentenoate hydratase/2-oxohepta-3-ene-1,7-dioic acid hydratase in catechol pathway
MITSKDARDVSVEDASDYILGYTIGNDLTARFYQDPRRAGGQFSRAKAFDQFAPLGPVLVSAKAFGSREGKTVRTLVNGETFQDSPLDLIHGPEKLLSFLSQGKDLFHQASVNVWTTPVPDGCFVGTTLPAGTAIMTGTPAGIGFFREPKYNLKDGDEVEITITSIGTLKNKMVFA